MVQAAVRAVFFMMDAFVRPVSFGFAGFYY